MSKEVLDKQVGEWRKEVDRLNDLIAHATGNVSSATANKAAEEGEMTVGEILKVAEEVGISFVTDERRPDNSTIIDFALCVIAADRASRQVANKAEVEPVVIEVLQVALHALKKAPELRALGFNELHASDCKDGIDSAGCTTKDYAKAAEDIQAIIEKAREAVRALLATPPATTGGANATPTGAMPKDLAIQCLNALAGRDPKAYKALSDFVVSGGCNAATTGASTSREDDFAKIVRSSCGKQVLFFKEESEDDGNTLHIVMTSNDAHFDMKMKGIPDESFKSSLDKADQKMADQALQQIKDLGFGEEE